VTIALDDPPDEIRRALVLFEDHTASGRSADHPIQSLTIRQKGELVAEVER